MTMNDDHETKQDRYERLIDRADWLRTERKDREWEKAMEEKAGKPLDSQGVPGEMKINEER